MTINVEYNQLDPLLRATVSPEGDVNDDSGWSPFPGGSLPAHYRYLTASHALCMLEDYVSNPADLAHREHQQYNQVV